jgi:hypothetical protein
LEDEDKAKYIVEIKTLSRAMKIPKEKLTDIKGAIGGKRLTRMKKECVDCPVMKKPASFIECFTCKNFLRRIKGKVECAGSPL